jgi:uncharacterized protein with ParB-like and HNH nuclease domain
VTLLPVVDVDRIDGKPRTVSELFTARKYSVDYYQREYAWTQANVIELLGDLSGRFLDNWDETHEREDTLGYRPYFLGPIVTNNRGSTLYLVDGQQRLTTLTLMLIYLHHLQAGRPPIEQVEVKHLVVSTRVGKWSFNVDVEDRRDCMEALLNGVTPAVTPGDSSVENLWNRYQDIEQLFPYELRDRKLPYFIDWLLERVMVVEISTSDQDMALEIFETMNDRGLRLTTTDMLKSYLLAMIRDSERIKSANQLWRSRIAELAEAADKGDSDFIRNWLRAKYADTIRERRKDAAQGDFDVIGTAPHKWVRDHKDDLALRRSGDFAALVERDFARLSNRYLQLLEASQRLIPGFEEVFYNAYNGFTFQYPLILAAVSPADDDEMFQAKTRMVAGWTDIFVARRMVNYRNYGYSTVAYTMFNLMKDIRDLDLQELADVLGARVTDMEGDFSGVARLNLTMTNGNRIKYLLARITAWLEARCEKTVTFADFVNREQIFPFEIEHVWANHWREHPELGTQQAFDDQRNRFGGLLLLPKDFNASYGDRPYSVKLPLYLSQDNVLAQSLNGKWYEHNPTFNRLMTEFDLPFRPTGDESFTIDDCSDRQRLYQRLCEAIWDPGIYGLVVADSKGETAAQAKQNYFGVSLRDLVTAELLHDGQELKGSRNGVDFLGTVTGSGEIVLSDGKAYENPSKAGAAALGIQVCNGWYVWQIETPRGWVRLSRVREDLLERRRA